ncbi:unnamed protein product [Rotaria sp. Silwood2]|nr:unnamed protein product [Rotaria sp. Silwood2]
MIYLFILVDNIDLQTNRYESSKCQQFSAVKYIFDLAYWRGLNFNDPTNRSSWCDIPDKLRLISNAICRIYNLGDCKRLPCRMIYASPSTLEDVKCMNDGRRLKIDDNVSIEHQSNLQCKRGFTLDLFLKKYDNSAYPSIIADPLVPISKELYIDVLYNNFRSCDSMWGFIFNFESISNYPWAADSQNLKLFDITLGYDRSVYDLIPAPWLFNYVEQLTFNSKRLSIEKAMSSKKPIHSITISDNYWTNTLTLSSMQQKKSNTSHVRAPILWMNNVDNYGTCGNNIRSLPEHIVEIQRSINRDLKDRGSYNWEAGKLTLSSEYLFTIAIENSLGYDYITEKLWHPLIAGSVPIYLGAPNVEDWLPCETDCIIDLRKFKTPKDAAIEEKNNEIKSLKSERRKDKNDFENKMKIKLNEIEQQYINELKTKENQMRELERQHDDKLNIIRSMAASNTITSEQFLIPINSASSHVNLENPTEHVYHNQQQQYHRVEMIISQNNNNTPTLNSTSRRHPYTPNTPNTPNTESMNIENGSGHIVVAHPRQQRRRSRSLSEIWLEHRPQGTVQTETLLQPKFHKKVCTQQVPAKEEIVRTTKYVLTHQNLDAQGEIVTDFVKGDVLASSTGGVNVIFNDVERLTCTSPPDPLMLHKRCQSEERILQETTTQSPSSRQGPAVAPKRFRM